MGGEHGGGVEDAHGVERCADDEGATDVTMGNERLAGALERIGAVYRTSEKKTAIKTSNRLAGWAERCRNDDVPNAKCVRALTAASEAVGAAGCVGR